MHCFHFLFWSQTHSSTAKKSVLTGKVRLLSNRKQETETGKDQLSGEEKREIRDGCQLDKSNHKVQDSTGDVTKASKGYQNPLVSLHPVIFRDSCCDTRRW